jgi:hypothetical protein
MAKANRPVPSRKISETLLEYAAPAIDILPDDAPCREVEMRLQAAAAMWNAVALSERGDRDCLDRMKRDLGNEPGFGAAECTMLFDMMVERKRRLYGSDSRLIGEVKVIPEGRGGFRVRAEARLPAGETQGDDSPETSASPAVEAEATTAIADLTPEQIWERIAWSCHKVPLDEFNAVRQHRDRIVPMMLGTLREVAADPERFEAETAYHGHEYALLLLAELRVQAAFPAIVEFLHAIAGLEEGLLGDMTTEDLPAILASTFDGRVDLLKRLVEDDALDELVRGAALVAMASLVLHGRIDRTELISYVGRLIAELPRDPSLLWNNVASVILDLRLHEHRQALCGLLDEDVFEEGWIQRGDIEQEFAEDSDPKRHRAYRLIEDVGAEVNRIPWYGSKAWSDEDHSDAEDEWDGDDCCEGPAEGDETIQVPYVREEAKVGRNDPCPCGSGKKHKKCCGK